MDKLQEAQLVAAKANAAEPTIRDEWKVYGEVIADGQKGVGAQNQKQKFNAWLVENKLDIRERGLRTKAMWLAENYDSLKPYFETGCPLERVHNPVAIYNKYRALTKAEQPEESQANNDERPERETADADTERLERDYQEGRSQMMYAAQALMALGVQKGVTSADGFKSGSSDVLMSPISGDWYEAAKPTQTWEEIGPNGYVGKAQGYAIRIVIDRIEAEIYRDGADGAGPRAINIINQ